MPKPSLFQELKRRNVIKAAISYIVISFALLEAADIVFPIFNISDVVLRWLFIILVVCFPGWVFFSWVYERTHTGFKKTEEVAHGASLSANTGRRLNAFIIGGLAIAIVLLVAERVLNLTEGMIDVSDDKSIAVLAFSDMSPNQDQEYFSDGISEELLNLLAKIPELRVISRTSSFSYKDKNMTLEKIGEELKVTHILEGSVRKSGDNLRITTQLIEVTGGHHLWSETYNLEMEDILKIQDEIAEAVIRQLKITLLGEIPKTQNDHDVSGGVNLSDCRITVDVKCWVEGKTNGGFICTPCMKKAVDILI